MLPEASPLRVDSDYVDMIGRFVLIVVVVSA